MPTPLAHAVGGWAAVLLDRPGRFRRAATAVLFVVAIANLPDLDFLPGLLTGDPRLYHRGPTHSLAAALLVAAVIGGVARRAGVDWRGWFVLTFAVYASHLLLDAITPDTFGAAGIPLFWPVTRHLFALPVPLPHGLAAFVDLQLGTDSRDFVSALLSWHAAAIMLVEAVLALPLLAAAWLVRWVRRGGGRRFDEVHHGKMPRST